LGEVTRLKWAEVDLSGHALRLSDSKTGKSVRPIGGAALKILAELPRSCDYVFPATRLSNAPYGSLPKAWGRVIALAKNEEANPLEGLTPHGLRHAFASVGGDLGLSEITIAALIGHASASVTGRYIHALDSALIAMADKVCQEIETQMKVF
jgi:integrase